MWYVFICEDTPDSLTARLQARPAHLARLEALKATSNRPSKRITRVPPDLPAALSSPNFPRSPPPGPGVPTTPIAPPASTPR